MVNKLNDIPATAERSRILNAKQTAALFGVSLPHFRRLYKAGKVPAPIRIGERKLGWPMGKILDFVAAKIPEAA